MMPDTIPLKESIQAMGRKLGYKRCNTYKPQFNPHSLHTLFIVGIRFLLIQLLLFFLGWQQQKNWRVRDNILLQITVVRTTKGQLATLQPLTIITSCCLGWQGLIQLRLWCKHPWQLRPDAGANNSALAMLLNMKAVVSTYGDRFFLGKGIWATTMISSWKLVSIIWHNIPAYVSLNRYPSTV